MTKIRVKPRKVDAPIGSWDERQVTGERPVRRRRIVLSPRDQAQFVKALTENTEPNARLRDAARRHQ